MATTADFRDAWTPTVAHDTTMARFVPIPDGPQCIEDGCVRTPYDEDRCKTHADIETYRLVRLKEREIKPGGLVWCRRTTDDWLTGIARSGVIERSTGGGHLRQVVLVEIQGVGTTHWPLASVEPGTWRDEV